MTAEIINLRRVRKTKVRLAEDAQAEVNRIKFGQTKADRERERAQKALELRALDAKRRDRDSNADDT